MKSARMTEYISLKPNRDLLNVKFESYHLGSATLQLERKSFLQPVAYYPLTDEHYSFSHLRAHAVQNLLVLDLWNNESNVVYFVDDSYAVMGLPYDKVYLVKINSNFFSRMALSRVPNLARLIFLVLRS